MSSSGAFERDLQVARVYLKELRAAISERDRSRQGARSARAGARGESPRAILMKLTLL